GGDHVNALDVPAFLQHSDADDDADRRVRVLDGLEIGQSLLFCIAGQLRVNQERLSNPRTPIKASRVEDGLEFFGLLNVPGDDQHYRVHPGQTILVTVGVDGLALVTQQIDAVGQLRLDVRAVVTASHHHGGLHELVR